MLKDKKPFRFLIVEDNPGDFAIVEELLLEQIANPLIVHTVTYNEAAETLLHDQDFSAILLDLSLPDKNGQQLITDMLQINTSCCPVIILTGYADIEFSIKSISLGVVDYLQKDDLSSSMLYKSIIYAIERKKNTFELKESHKQYSDLFQLSPQPMCLYEMQTFKFIQVNQAAIDQYGYNTEEFLDMTLLDLLPPDERQKTAEHIADQKRMLNQTYAGKSHVYKKNGELVDVETFSTPIIINDKETTLVIAIDVTEKNLYEQRMVKAIIKTQEDERYEIGGELHDNVCQLLAVSQITLGMLKDSLAPPKLKFYEQCRENIALASTEIRNLSHRLAPVFFDDSTLEEAFIRLFKTFTLNEHLKTELHFDDALKKYPISIEIQLNLYRILQEQLRNILKYADASLIQVDVIIYKHRLKMSISDNGVGFNMNKVKDGIGLANMKRRTELFSGTFKIASAPGRGCTILIDLPLAEAG